MGGSGGAGKSAPAHEAVVPAANTEPDQAVGEPVCPAPKLQPDCNQPE